MSIVRVVRQQAGAEDLLLGSGTVWQERNGKKVKLTKISGEVIPLDETGISISDAFGSILGLDADEIKILAKLTQGVILPTVNLGRLEWELGDGTFIGSPLNILAQNWGYMMEVWSDMKNNVYTRRENNLSDLTDIDEARNNLNVLFTFGENV
jgi:hypothetical protein